MKAQLLQLLITTLMTFFSEDLMKKFADTLLDFVEDKVAGSKSTLDDRLVLPLCARVRQAFNIPDDDANPVGYGGSGGAAMSGTDTEPSEPPQGERSAPAPPEPPSDFD